MLRPITTAAMSLALCASAFAYVHPTVPEGSFHSFRGMPASDINYVKAPEHPRVLRATDKIGNSKFDNTDWHDLREVKTDGQLRILVILVDYQDTQWTQGAPDSHALVDDMLNGDNFTFQDATGSAAAYYRTVSGGQFQPQFDVYGPVKLSKISREYVTPTEPEYYTNSEGKQVQVYPAGRMVEEAVKAIDDQVDFADYDSNGDGMVDFVYLFFAGKGATTGGNKYNVIWPHAFTLTSAIGAPLELDGVKVNRYCCSSELGLTNKLSGVGTFCHEFAHVLGLPDLYDTANNGSATTCFTPGTFDCMDAGNYNNDEHTPPMFSSYEQYGLEWMKPVTITGGGRFTMLPLTARQFAYKVNTEVDTEYFLLEARDKQGYDKYLEAHGMAIWHIDFHKNAWDNNAVNNTASHQRIDLIEADNELSTATRAGDLFPGSAGVCEFVDNVTPSFISWNNQSTGYGLTEIQRNFDGTVSFLCTSGDGVEMPGAAMESPAVQLTEVGEHHLAVRIPAVEGAKEYRVSVYPAEKFDGAYLEEYVDGWYFRPIDLPTDGYAEVMIEGLETGKSYGVMAYALNDVNVSRSSAPLTVSTVAASFEDAVINLYLSKSADEDDATVIAWDAVEGATAYDVAVVESAPVLTETGIEPIYEHFDDYNMQQGWSGSGKYDNRAKYSGIEAPSYLLCNSGAYLQSPVFDQEVKYVSFWARKSFDEEGCELRLHGLDAKGCIIYTETFPELSRAGAVHSVELPEGCYAIRIDYRFNVTGLHCNIDDVVVEFAGEYTHNVPVGIEKIQHGETVAVVKGLQAGTRYMAYVTPIRGEELGQRSKVVHFFPYALEVNDVKEIAEADGLVVANGVVSSDAPYSVYALDGVCLVQNVCGSYLLPGNGIYIVKTANRAFKVSK